MRPVADPSIGVVIVNYNGGQDLRRCAEAILLQLDDADRVVVVDNASTDGSAATVEGIDDRVRVVRRANDGFGGGANAGAAVAGTELLLFLNPDAELCQGAIASLRRSLASTGGIVGPVIIEGQDNKVCYGATIDLFASPGSITTPSTQPLYVPGCALGIPSSLFARLGGFDARYFLFMEDVELCWRGWIAGASVSVDPGARCKHRGGGSIPGGYAVSGGWSTSVQRIALRERNGLATCLTCLPGSLLGVGLGLVTARMLALGMIFLLLGRPAAAGEVLSGLGWFGRELPRTLGRRRSLHGRRWRPLRHLARTCFYVDVVRTFGLPRIEARKPV